VNGVTAGQQFYVQVTGADTTAFDTGNYALTLNLGTGALPAVTLPNIPVLNGLIRYGGHGSSMSASDEVEEYDFYSINAAAEARDAGQVHHGMFDPLASNGAAGAAHDTVSILVTPEVPGGTLGGSAADLQRLSDLALASARPFVLLQAGDAFGATFLSAFGH